MNLGVVLASHGLFAQAALESACMLAGEQEGVECLSLFAHENIADYEARFRETIQAMSKKFDKTVVLCDIYGGTPFNIATKLLVEGHDFLAYTGLNMPVLIELLLSKDSVQDELELKDMLTQTYQEAMVEIVAPELVSTEAEAEDDFDL